MIRRLALFAPVLSVLVACQSSAGGSGAATTSASSSLALALRPLGQGSIYLVLGDPGSGAIWRVDIGQKRAQQLTHPQPQYGVSWLDASPAGLVASDASSGVDVTAVYRDGRMVPVAGHGYTPAISPEGDVAYVFIPDIVGGTGPQEWRIMLIPQAGGPERVLYSQSAPDLNTVDMVDLQWGPSNRLAVISAPGDRNGSGGTPKVLVLGADGKVEQSIQPAFGDIASIAWGGNAPGIAVAGMTQSVLVALDGRQVAIPRTWWPMCWSPKGDALLMRRDGLHLGLWRPANPSEVEALPPLPPEMNMGGCSWLEAPATGA